MKKKIPLTIALTASMSFGIALAQDQSTPAVSAQSASTAEEQASFGVALAQDQSSDASTVPTKAVSKSTTDSAKTSDGSCAPEDGKCASGSCG